MFDVVCENVARVAEASLQMQQEAFKRWVGLWPAEPAAAGSSAEQARRFETTWADFCDDVLQKQWETWAVQFESGLKHLDDASRLASGTVAMWWKFFEPLQLSAVPPGPASARQASALERLERSALEQTRHGLPPPRQVYEAQNRGRIDWSRFPCWAQPSDPDLFEGGHEG